MALVLHGSVLGASGTEREMPKRSSFAVRPILEICQDANFSRTQFLGLKTVSVDRNSVDVQETFAGSYLFEIAHQKPNKRRVGLSRGANSSAAICIEYWSGKLWNSIYSIHKLTVYGGIDVKGWCPSEIAPNQLNAFGVSDDIPILDGIFAVGQHLRFMDHPCSFSTYGVPRRGSGCDGSICSSPVEVQADKETYSAKSGQGSLPPCRYYLPFSGCSATVTGIGGLLLGGQIFGIMLVALGFSGLAALGLIRGLDYDDRKGWPIAAISGLCAFYFFYWSATGWPLLGQYWIGR
jgi:hypothetical protein